VTSINELFIIYTIHLTQGIKNKEAIIELLSKYITLSSYTLNSLKFMSCYHLLSLINYTIII